MPSDDRPTDEPARVERIASEPMPTRDDLVLVAIPLALLAGGIVGLVTGLGLRTGVTIGSVVALCALGYAIFGDPPIERNGGRNVS
ncbi:hypothetical protein MBEHAL_1000 [Halarchaeum acidiphilum MH1-52-1]|uniref:Uncharacterized protein n=1 Tax=Halarchaeum acidiphilum MH1-52-1 TaxID=1261545 RepID=U2YTA4_9EURY|nr:hypothetical protein [Halarchaeum acidiphilum]GAD52240.1 hypothetical protein MBEHAL_1000 [Halarchaeum acidiphilum MH1-52-1]